MADPTVRLKGLRDLNRAFKAYGNDAPKKLRKTFLKIAEPVRTDAEAGAVSEITRIGVPWSRMRMGVTTKSVYVAPRQRGRRGRDPRKRPNLAPLLMDKAMQPALDAHVADTERAVGRMLDELGRDWERA